MVSKLTWGVLDKLQLGPPSFIPLATPQVFLSLSATSLSRRCSPCSELRSLVVEYEPLSLRFLQASLSKMSFIELCPPGALSKFSPHFSINLLFAASRAFPRPKATLPRSRLHEHRHGNHMIPESLSRFVPLAFCLCLSLSLSVRLFGNHLRKQWND